ncbi:MAG: hypothetical protein JWP78_1752 [Mucilaginibacter sp.]|nr:hypothetical protein [Mucilaginibacter sp.]
MELISIIMPAYNVERFIEASIKSVLEQTYTNWELLIINDGSTDNTRHIAQGFSSRDSRVRVINQENKRLGAARNTGIRNSKGFWIAFLDSDDLWSPTKLEAEISASNKFPTASIIYTDGWIFQHEDLKNLSPYPTIVGKLIGHKEMYKMEYEKNYIPVLSVLVKRSLIDQIGLQEERKTFYGCEDWDYWLRMARVGADFYGVPQKLFYYRRHGNNMSDNGVNMHLAQTSVLLKNFEQEVFMTKEATSMFKKLISPLIVGLIKEKRFTDIDFILNEIQKIFPATFYKRIEGLIKIGGYFALIPVAIIVKLQLLKLRYLN